MRKTILIMCLLMVSAIFSSCCCRRVRTATDITPGNIRSEKLDWRYGRGDIKIQTTKLNCQLMDRWLEKTGYNISNGKPRIVITEIDNCTDNYISTDMIRDIIECAAIDDGRYTVVVGNIQDEHELNYFMNKILCDPKYANSSRIKPCNATAPQFLARVRISKAVTSDCFCDYEDYRMTVTLYDIETQEIIDTAYDVLSKRVRR